MADLFGPEVGAEFLGWFRSYTDSPNETVQPGPREVLVRRRDGVRAPYDVSMTPMFMRVPLFICLLHDITHHKQSATALQRAALVDPLTRIANRRHFDSFLELQWQRAMRTGQPLALLVLDVDHFKLYNDTLGHQQGDDCLCRVAAALHAHARGAADLAARYGGEEFVLLLADTPAATAAQHAEAIRRHIEELEIAHPRSPTSAWVTVSIGVAALTPSPLDQVQQLFVAADRAMYTAKEQGRNQVCAVDSADHAWAGVKAIPSA
jgi:diguanylate cyclase (GGDEF)-like protein